MHPRVGSVDVGKSLELNCSVSGTPVLSLEWLHNGQPITGSSRIRFISRNLLHITNVERRDKGMYQCLAHNDFDSVQASAQIELGGMDSHMLGIRFQYKWQIASYYHPLHLHSSHFIYSPINFVARYRHSDHPPLSWPLSSTPLSPSLKPYVISLADDAPQFLSTFSEQTLQPGQPLSLKVIRGTIKQNTFFKHKKWKEDRAGKWPNLPVKEYYNIKSIRE